MTLLPPLQVAFPEPSPMVRAVGAFIFVFGLIGMAFTEYMRRRNEKIYAFRMELARMVFVCEVHDSERGLGCQWRWDALHAVSYEAMMRQFWRRLESFYRDRSFLDPEATRD